MPLVQYFPLGDNWKMCTDKEYEAVVEKYLEHVKTRSASTDYEAKEKLERIEELADIIFLARENYKQSNSNWSYFQN